MLTVIQFIVFYMILPVIYFFVAAFDFLLIAKASTLKHRWQALGGAVNGFLISIVIILLDGMFGGLFGSVAPPENIQQTWPAAVIMAFVGFFLLLFIDLLVRRGVIPFTIMFTVTALIVSAYYLLTLTQIRTITAIGAIGFLVGAIVYFMMFPSSIIDQIRPTQDKKEE